MKDIGMAAKAPGEANADAARPLRPQEMEDWLNLRLYHPLSWLLARRLASTPVTPNMVSVAGGLMVVLAGLAYTRLTWPYSAALGLALHMAWHILDGADGDLARLTRRMSPRGEMVDGICDYASHIVLYLMLGGLLMDDLGWFAWPLTVAAGVSHIVQANHVEVQRRFYLNWIYGVPWLASGIKQGDGQFGAGKTPARRSRAATALAWLARRYLRLAAGMTPHAQKVDDAVRATGGDAEQLARIRGQIRSRYAPLLRLQQVIGPNPRAIILGLSMFAGSPAWYFIVTTLAGNAVLLWSVRRHNQSAKQICSALGD